MAAPERRLRSEGIRQALAGKAALYVFRNEAIGGSVKMSLSSMGHPRRNRSEDFHWVTISWHTLVVGKAENESVVEFTAASGQTCFVWQ